MPNGTFVWDSVFVCIAIREDAFNSVVRRPIFLITPHNILLAAIKSTGIGPVFDKFTNSRRQARQARSTGNELL